MRSTYAYIDINSIRNNVHLLQEKAGDRTFMAIIKANAYGHGDIEMLENLYDMGVRHFGVSTLYEALRLREVKKDIYILMIAPCNRNDFKVAYKYDIAVAVQSHEDLKEYLSLEDRPKAHIKIDTGMHRIGFTYEDALSITNLVKEAKFDGIFTHIARADEIYKRSANKQIELFQKVLRHYNNNGIDFNYIHFANTATTIGFDLSFSNMVRCGIGIYGLNPSFERQLEGLQPILSLYSEVISLRTIDDGEGVGYGHKYIADGTRTIATVPIGYADGYKRNMSGKAHVYIKGYVCPVVGTITMGQIMVDVTGRDIKMGDKVEIIGNHITADDLARDASTINYEIISSLQTRLKRIYIDGERE